MTSNQNLLPYKGLVLAAGMSSRLRPHTEDKPKCLLPAGNYTILEHAIKCFNSAGIDDYRIVTGYKADQIELLNLPTIHNPLYNKDNVLGSFYQARNFWKNGVIACYSDILFDHRILTELKETQGDIVIVVDPNWENHYIDRINHPVSEALLVDTDMTGNVTNMGKEISSDSVVGEFLGIFKISSTIAPQLNEHISRLIEQDEGHSNWRNKYIAHYFTLLAQEGWSIKTLECRHRWHEVDTYEDFSRIPASLANREY